MDSVSLATGFLAGLFAGGAFAVILIYFWGILVDAITVQSYSDLTDAALRMGDEYAKDWDAMVLDMRRRGRS